MVAALTVLYDIIDVRGTSQSAGGITVSYSVGIGIGLTALGTIAAIRAQW